MKFKLDYRRLILISAITLGIPSLVVSQESQGVASAPSVSQRLFFGGNLSLQFGTYTYIDVSPEIGIWLLPRIAVAAGPSYKYLKDPLGATDVFGGKAYSRLVVINDLNNLIPIGYRISLFLHAEYESMSYRSDFFMTFYDRERFAVNTLLGGVGISQYFGLKSSVNISVLWVMNETVVEIYNSPEIRIGVTF